MRYSIILSLAFATSTLASPAVYNWNGKRQQLELPPNLPGAQPGAPAPAPGDPAQPPAAPAPPVPSASGQPKKGVHHYVGRLSRSDADPFTGKNQNKGKGKGKASQVSGIPQATNVATLPADGATPPAAGNGTAPGKGKAAQGKQGKGKGKGKASQISQGVTQPTNLPAAQGGKGKGKGKGKASQVAGAGPTATPAPQQPAAAGGNNDDDDDDDDEEDD